MSVRKIATKYMKSLLIPRYSSRLKRSVIRTVRSVYLVREGEKCTRVNSLGRYRVSLFCAFTRCVPYCSRRDR